MMKISKERRDRWARLTREGPFNLWLKPQIYSADGVLDIDRLHQVAMQYGIDKREAYAHLNPGQQRMNLGNMLRKAVPPELYEGNDTPVVADQLPSEVVEKEPEKPLERASVYELLRLHGEIMDELRRREIVRTSNNPVGDYAELLFATAFGWELESSSASGHDARDKDGMRYQIKSRRLTRHNKSRQLSFMRGLPERKFDFLAAILFDETYRVNKAIILPHEGLQARSRFSSHANGWLLRLEDDCWQMPGARDVTSEIAAVAKAM